MSKSPNDTPPAAAHPTEMGEYGLIQAVPDDIRVALNTLIDTRTAFISAQFGDDDDKEHRTHDAYHAADRAVRVLIGRLAQHARAAVVDKERLDWLEAQSNGMTATRPTNFARLASRLEHMGARPPLRAAIDKARQEASHVTA